MTKANFSESPWRLRGATIAVGAPSAKGLVGVFDGAVYVFERPAGGWADGTQSAKLVGRPESQLGWSVAIAGDTIVAGATDDYSGPGSANVFVRSIGGWADMTQPTAILTAADGQVGDAFGIAAAIAEDTIVVGTLRGDAAYVYVRPAGGWADATQTAKLTSSDGGPAINLGSSVAIAGGTIVAGASQFCWGRVHLLSSGGWLGERHADGEGERRG